MCCSRFCRGGSNILLQFSPVIVHVDVVYILLQVVEVVTVVVGGVVFVSPSIRHDCPMAGVIVNLFCNSLNLFCRGCLFSVHMQCNLTSIFTVFTP